MATTIQQLPEKVNIKLYKGDDLQIKMRWYTDASKTTLVDLSGTSARMQIRDQEILYDVSPNITLGDSSSQYNIIILFPKGDTATFTWEEGVYDFEWTDSSGLTRTLFAGTVKVINDITV